MRARDAIELLTEDHREAERLFNALLGEERDDNDALFEALEANLRAHDAIEREIFYPRVRQELGDDVRDILEDSYEDHFEMNHGLDVLDELDPDDDDFHEKLTKLYETIAEHAKVDEEAQMFPKLRAKVSQRVLDEMGARMQERKAQFLDALGMPAR